MDVTLVLYDEDSVNIAKKIFHIKQKDIEDNEIPELPKEGIPGRHAYSRHFIKHANFKKSESKKYDNMTLKIFQKEIENQKYYNSAESFYELLIKYLKQCNESISHIYNNINIDRRIFSYIKHPENKYRISKKNVLTIILVLHLNIDDAFALLKKAGYYLSDSYKEDRIIYCYISNNIYNIDKINEELANQNCKLRIGIN